MSDVTVAMQEEPKMIKFCRNMVEAYDELAELGFPSNDVFKGLIAEIDRKSEGK